MLGMTNKVHISAIFRAKTVFDVALKKAANHKMLLTVIKVHVDYSPFSFGFVVFNLDLHLHSYKIVPIVENAMYSTYSDYPSRFLYQKGYLRSAYILSQFTSLAIFVSYSDSKNLFTILRHLVMQLLNERIYKWQVFSLRK